MSQRNESDIGRDSAVTDALRLIAHDDDVTPVPASIQHAVMRAWDARDHQPVSRRFRRPLFQAIGVAAACALLSFALWTRRAPGDGDVRRTPAPAGDEIAATDGTYLFESIAEPGMLLVEDPASLRIVRLSVQPSWLMAFGYPVPNPADTQPLDVEMLIGLDGVPRAIRRAR